jgi:hypothetical protein
MRRTPKKALQEQPQHRCRDCAHSYDWHSKALDGHLILCRCRFDEKTEYGRWCKFLSDPECAHFKQRLTPEPDAEAQ